jgi:uncharacterized protein YkwD
MIRSYLKVFLRNWLAWSAVYFGWAATAYGQVIAHRDFDVLQVAPARASDDGVERASAIKRIVESTNRFRRGEERGQLRPNNKLAEAAQEFAEYMARTDRYGHEADGRTPAERVLARGYEYCLLAENIAMRYSTAGYETEPLADGFVQGWIDSPEHRKNMLDPDVTQIGVGLAMSDESGRYYGVQIFARAKSEAIEFAVVNRTRIDVEYELGDQKFSLPARMTRTHSRCRPPELTVPLSQQLSQQKPQTIAAKNGGRYVIEQGGEGVLRLEVATESGRQP